MKPHPSRRVAQLPVNGASKASRGNGSARAASRSSPGQKNGKQNPVISRALAPRFTANAPPQKWIAAHHSSNGSGLSVSRTFIQKHQRAEQFSRVFLNYTRNEYIYRTWLQRYHPFNQTLAPGDNLVLFETLSEFARYTEIRGVPGGTVLFNPGESDCLIYYLLSGQLRMKVNTASGNSPHFYIIKSTAPGQYTKPVGGDAMPRTSHAQVVRRSVFLCIEMENPALLDSLQRLLQSNGDETHKPTDENQWIEQLLGHRWLKQLDGKLVQNLFSFSERIVVNAGEVLQERGKPVDYVHIIEKGTCLVFAGSPMSLLMTVGMMAGNNGTRAGSRIRTVTSGTCLGDVHAINPNGSASTRPCPFTAQMQTGGVVHRIPRDKFSQQFGHCVLDWLVSRIGWPQESLAGPPMH